MHNALMGARVCDCRADVGVDLWVPKNSSATLTWGFAPRSDRLAMGPSGSARGQFLPSRAARDRPVGAARPEGSLQRRRDPRVAPSTRGAETPDLASSLRTRRPSLSLSRLVGWAARQTVS